MRGVQIGERIADLREWKKETQQQLADSIGVKRETVKFWESGERQIKGHDIIKLAEHFGVSSDYILELSPIKSIGAKEKAASEITGLSETVVETLSFYLQKDPASVQIINHILEHSGFWSAVSRLDAIQEDIDDLKKYSERIETEGKDDKLIDAYNALFKEIRLLRFEGTDSLERVFDDVSQYWEAEKIAEKHTEK